MNTKKILIYILITMLFFNYTFAGHLNLTLYNAYNDIVATENQNFLEGKNYGSSTKTTININQLLTSKSQAKSGPSSNYFCQYGGQYKYNVNFGNSAVSPFSYNKNISLFSCKTTLDLIKLIKIPSSWTNDNLVLYCNDGSSSNKPIENYDYFTHNINKLNKGCIVKNLDLPKDNTIFFGLEVGNPTLDNNQKYFLNQKTGNTALTENFELDHTGDLTRKITSLTERVLVDYKGKAIKAVKFLNGINSIDYSQLKYNGSNSCEVETKYINCKRKNSNKIIPICDKKNLWLYSHYNTKIQRTHCIAGKIIKSNIVDGTYSAGKGLRGGKYYSGYITDQFVKDKLKLNSKTDYPTIKYIENSPVVPTSNYKNINNYIKGKKQAVVEVTVTKDYPLKKYYYKNGYTLIYDDYNKVYSLSNFDGNLDKAITSIFNNIPSDFLLSRIALFRHYPTINKNIYGYETAKKIGGNIKGIYKINFNGVNNVYSNICNKYLKYYTIDENNYNKEIKCTHDTIIINNDKIDNPQMVSYKSYNLFKNIILGLN